MEMTMNMGAFQELNNCEMTAVDGGSMIIDCLIVTAGAVAFAGGTMVTLVGAATLNPFAAGSGITAATLGLETIHKIGVKYSSR